MPQFTEEDARRIFARAAEHQHAIDDAPPSLSLAELQEVGQAAGLSPESIAKAIADDRVATAPEAPTSIGGSPTTVQKSRTLPGPLTDEMWAAMVSQLRHTFTSQGVTSTIGQTREWTATNGSGGLSALRVVATPTSDGTHVTLSTSTQREAANARRVGLWGPVLLVALFTVAGIADGGAMAETSYWLFMAALASLAVVIPRINRAVFSRWASRKDAQFTALLDQFDLLSRDDTGGLTLSPSHPASPALDLDALAEAPHAASDATRSRTRA